MLHLTPQERALLFMGASFAAIRLQRLIDPYIMRLGRGSSLTPRELAVLRHLSNGKRVREIARLLELGEETVRSHLKKAQAKLGVHDRRLPSSVSRPHQRQPSDQDEAPEQGEPCPTKFGTREVGWQLCKRARRRFSDISRLFLSHRLDDGNTVARRRTEPLPLAVECGCRSSELDPGFVNPPRLLPSEQDV